MALERVVYKLIGILQGDAQPAEVETIVLALTRTVHPESWETMGGSGTVVAVKLNLPSDKFWRLVVLSEFQSDVKKLLDDIRS